MAIKNIAPFELTTVQVGGPTDKQFTKGEIRVDNAGRKYIRAKVIPGTGSVTGAKHTIVVPYCSSNVHTPGEYTHDLTDTASALQTLTGIQKFSMMTAVTHHGWVQVKGPAKYLTAATNTAWVDGSWLYVSTTDNRLNNLNVASTENAVAGINLTKCAIALENNGVSGGTMATGVTKSIWLIGNGYE